MGGAESLPHHGTGWCGMSRMSIGVLSVEDELEFFSQFTTAVQSDAELHLLAAVCDGASALAALEGPAPDVMLVDLGLPDIDGVQLIRRAVERHPSVDVLVVTVFGDDEHVLASIEAGATGY